MKVNLPSTIAALALLHLASVNAQSTDAVDKNQDVTVAMQQQEAVAVEEQLEQEQTVEQEVEILTDDIDVSLQEAEVGEEATETVDEIIEDVVEQAEDVLDDETLSQDITSIEETVIEDDALVDEILNEAALEQETIMQDDVVQDEAVQSESAEEIIQDEVSVEQFSDESALTDTLTELSGEESMAKTNAVNPNAYNFERPIPQEGDVYIPVLGDAKVFAEFIDSLPAVVNYYTYASEDEVIAFYTQNFGEPVEQERKRGRLTVIYYLEDISTRVVISEQDNYRQVDVLQEDAGL